MHVGLYDKDMHENERTPPGDPMEHMLQRSDALHERLNALLAECPAERLTQLGFQIDSLRYGASPLQTRIEQLAVRTRSCLRALYDLLLRPVEDRLGERRLVVVPQAVRFSGEAFFDLDARWRLPADRLLLLFPGGIRTVKKAQAVLATTGAAAVMVGRAAQGNPWAIREIVGDSDGEPTREEVVAELVLFMRETVRELGERKATGFLKKFYGWYLGHGRFPKPFKQELLQSRTIAEVEQRLLIAAPGAAALLEGLEREHSVEDEVLLEGLPISAYGGG